MSRLLLLAQEIDIADTYFDIGKDEKFVVLLVAIGCVTGIVISLTAIISGVVSSVHRRNAEYELKREMLDRGMTAEEIAQVIETAPPPEDGVERWIASWGRCKKKKS